MKCFIFDLLVIFVIDHRLNNSFNKFAYLNEFLMTIFASITNPGSFFALAVEILVHYRKFGRKTPLTLNLL